MDLISYINWHFVGVPKFIIKLTRNYLLFCDHFFSIRQLLKTLLAPWKRQTFNQGPGFNPSKFLEIVLSNLVSRFIGACVRIIVISIGLVSQILVLLIGTLVFLLLIMLPVFDYPLFWIINSKVNIINRRKSDWDRFKNGQIPDMEEDEMAYFIKTPTGQFLFSRLLVPFKEVNNTSLSTIVKKYQLKPEDIYEVMRWYNHAKDEEEEYQKFWELYNLLRINPIAKDWAYGYTVNLDKYTTSPITAGYKIPHLVGRREEIDRIQRILARSGQNNVLLVGDPGSGRHAIVTAFALDIWEGKVMDPLLNKRIVELNLNLLLSEAKIPTEIKGIVNRVLAEAQTAGNIILVIDNFEKFISTGEGNIDMSDVFNQIFSKDNIQVIAITDRAAYHKLVIPNTIISKIFEAVEIDEISKNDTLKILEHLTPVLEKEYKIFIPYPSLSYILKKADLISNIPNPEKTIDIIKEAVVLASFNKESILSLTTLDKIISQKTKIPQGAIDVSEKEKLINLENLLHQHIVNQNQAIEEISRSLRRARLELKAKGKPIGTFLFLGPTGVGKTETAKALAMVYFGSIKQMIRLDMSQFQGTDALKQLLGTLDSNQPGILVSQVRDKPFSVLLLDEIEKTSQDVINLLLTILDEGYVNDSFGRKVSFENTIIIATSNAASEFIRENIKTNPDNPDLTKQLTEFILKQRIFTPEFINRFDALVIYHPLTGDNLKNIAQLMLMDLNKRLKEKNISINITDQLIQKIAKAGSDPQFGARPMRRVISEKIEDFLAKKLLNNEINEGDSVDIFDI